MQGSDKGVGEERRGGNQRKELIGRAAELGKCGDGGAEGGAGT